MRRLSIMLTALALALPACGGADSLKPPGTPVNLGAQYFMQYCSACHGADATGNGPVAPVLRTPPADLTRIAQRRGGRFPDAEVASFIDGQADIRAHGSREMPIWGQRFGEKFGGGTVGQEFARGHLVVLLEYLKSIQK
jgi:mono/diheme cytochrome c family protein